MYLGVYFLSHCKVNVKVKMHTLDIAPLHSESPAQERSGMEG